MSAPFLPGGRPVNRADARRWQKAATTGELGELVIGWLNGKLTETPCHGAPMDKETIEMLPLLVSVNRAGFVTTGSQADRAGRDLLSTYVTGFADDRMLGRLRHAARECAITVTACRGREHGERHPARELWHCEAREVLGWWTAACPRARAELRASWHVKVADPVPGRSSLLACVLTVACEPGR